MKLLFERSHPGRRCTILPACDVPTCEIDPALCREQAPHLPQMSENELSRHYTELANRPTASTTASTRSAPAP